MDYTNKHKFSLPSYNDKIDIEVINNNMKILDGRLKNINLSDNVLTVDGERLEVNTSHLMPKSGGDFTGPITVNGATIDPIVEYVRDFKKDGKTWNQLNQERVSRFLGSEVTKYASGKMIIVMIVANHNQSAVWNFPTPFIEEPDYYTTGSWDYNNDGTPAYGAVTSIDLSNTSFKCRQMYNNNEIGVYKFVGRWK